MPKALFRHQLALGLTLSLGVGLSILATSLVSQWEISNQRLRFQRQIENLATALERSLNRYTDVLAFIGDYYAVAHQVNRQAFAEFVGRSLQSYTGIQALEWAAIVQQSERLAYERKIQLEGFPTFQITELDEDGSLIRASDRPYYLPVTYIEPLTNNESALGYDLNSNLTRATAIAQAKDTGKITATARIRLVQEKRDQFGFLMFLPLYQKYQPKQLKGFLLGVFRISDVVEGALKDLQFEINFTMSDHSANPAEQFLGQYDATLKQVTVTQGKQQVNTVFCPTIEACTRILTVGQRKWSIVFSPATDYPIETPYAAIATLVGGLLLTSCLVFFLNNLNRELEQTKSLNELKFRFFSMASHELRTPLSTILLSSEFLQNNYYTLSVEQQRTNIGRIYLTAKRMSQQITDLLMLTRAEVGKLEFDPEILNLEQFCLQVLDEIKMGISQTIQFTSQCQTTKAFLDKKLLRSLLTNLLSNAEKYSPADAPIQFRLICDGNTAIFEISDQGIGIPAEEQSRIWETFYRGSNTGEVAGSGLGLAVVKTCIELHRGEWAINSQEGQGTTVTVRLPLE